MAEKEYVLNGIKFASAAEYQNAKKELEGIAYIRQKNDMSDDRIVLNMYNKFIQKNVFRTQIGHDFLKELQERLMRSTVIDKSEVMKLPIYDEPDEIVLEASAVKEVGEPVKKRVDTAASIKSVSAAGAASKNAGSTAAVKAKAKSKSNIHMEYITSTSKQKVNDSEFVKYKRKYGWSVFINIVLILVIIAMVYITLNTNHVNILNYEERLQDEYAAWAEELLAKERELNALEREFKELMDN